MAELGLERYIRNCDNNTRSLDLDRFIVVFGNVFYRSEIPHKIF
jgi:hypothetical protein